MSTGSSLELILLHALPFDRDMWSAQLELLPGATRAPTLYGLGDDMASWVRAILQEAKGDRLIVAGCSVGGSCALELATAAPDRVAALVLIGTKARHKPDPALHALALQTLRQDGIEKAWKLFWEPLFSNAAEPRLLNEARRMALRLSPQDVARGVSAFHSRPSRDGFLANFSRPVHIVTGAHDTAPGVQTSAEQALAAANGRLHIVPECGHYVPLERPLYLNALLTDVIEAVRT